MKKQNRNRAIAIDNSGCQRGESRGIGIQKIKINR